MLAKIKPSLPNLAHDIEAAVPTLTAYGDAAPDLDRRPSDNTTQLSNSIVDEQQNLDEFLVSAIGFADIGNEVIGGNRQALTDVATRARADHRACWRCTTRRWAAASAASSRSRSPHRSIRTIIVSTPA